MKNGVFKFFCLGGMLAFAAVCWANVNEEPPATEQADAATSSESPYSAIWTRNVFDLTPKPPPPDTSASNNVAPPANIKLVGIYTIFGKRALLGVQDPPERGQPNKKEEYLTMREGERHGALEVMEIDPKARTVKIKNDEIVSTITFETNKPAGPAGMAGGPHPNNEFGGGFHPHMGVPLNNGMPAPLPNRMMRSSPSASYTPQGGIQPNLGSAGYATGYNYNGTGTAGSGGVSLGGFNTPQSPVNNNQPQQPVPPEVTAAMLQLQQAAAEQAGRPFPPLPPGYGPPGENGAPGRGATRPPAVP